MEPTGDSRAGSTDAAAGAAASGPAAAPAAPGPPHLVLRRKIVTTVILVGLCFGVVLTRAVWEGTRALAAGDAASQRGELREAITRWSRSARWYVPGAQHVSAAYDRLEKLARQAESQGDIATALAAWRGVRGSILATRSLYTPQSERLDPANQRIAVLMAAQEQQQGSAAGKAAAIPTDVRSDERAAWHYSLLARDEAPSSFWSLVAILGLAMWLGGGLLFALRGVTAEDVLVPRTAAYAGLTIASGLVIWMLGLYLA